MRDFMLRAALLVITAQAPAISAYGAGASCQYDPHGQMISLRDGRMIYLDFGARSRSDSEAELKKTLIETSIAPASSSLESLRYSLEKALQLNVDYVASNEARRARVREMVLKNSVVWLGTEAGAAAFSDVRFNQDAREIEKRARAHRFTSKEVRDVLNAISRWGGTAYAYIADESVREKTRLIGLEDDDLLVRFENATRAREAVLRESESRFESFSGADIRLFTAEMKRFEEGEVRSETEIKSRADVFSKPETRAFALRRFTAENELLTIIEKREDALVRNALSSLGNGAVSLGMHQRARVISKFEAACRNIVAHAPSLEK